ncbi:TIGR00159 family protein [Treponema phagedenis F0421]|uniref:diadenylate cyclase CdaA n=1 Tax=Treponema phagedenis TaxID=162 RepID=UPI0001F63D15|nr:diadenylate cyclase CdaA [Treponema phagedenis]EFW37437.1 TIGR00159 family protein [Treponema phagedenis F0421]
MQFIRTVFTLYTDYIRHILDIALLAFLIYKTYEILIQTQAAQLLKGALSLLVIYAIAFVFQLQTLLWLLKTITAGIVIGAAIVFQPELRKIFLKIGQGSWLRNNTLSKQRHIYATITAAEILSEKKRGLLIVFARRNNLKDIIDTGIRLNAEISSSLIVTIFGHDTPLHDGAIIVQNGIIVAAGCFLPLSEQQDIRKSFGTRHRAALGTSEETDAVVLIVSEETGAISLAYDSRLYYDLSSTDALHQLEHLLDLTIRDTKEQGGAEHEQNELA